MAKKKAAEEEAPHKNANEVAADPIPEAEEGVDLFVRIKKHPLGKTDNWESFQPEIVRIRGTEVISRQLISKPDMFEMAFAIAAECVDPRNSEKHLPAPI